MTIMTNSGQLGVADAKARFSELLNRVGRGERFLIARRGTPVAALVPPDATAPPAEPPLGLAAVAGALATWEELPEVVEEIYAARRRARDRDAPDLG